jgi:hypothetical protein
MCYEDSRSKFIRTSEFLVIASNKIKNTMEYCKNNINEINLHESNISEDWRQDYDGIENGNGWKDLNMKRKLQIQYNNDLYQYHKYYALCPLLLPRQTSLKNAIINAKEILRESVAAEIAYRPTLSIVQEIDVEVCTCTCTVLALVLTHDYSLFSSIVLLTLTLALSH